VNECGLKIEGVHGIEERLEEVREGVVDFEKAEDARKIGRHEWSERVEMEARGIMI